MKSLEIGKPCSEFTNTFVCHVTTYLGDGDEYHDFMIPVAADRVDALEKVFAKFDKMNWSDEYHTVKDAYEFFGRDGADDDEDARLEEWRYDYDCGTYFCHDRHEYYWYSPEGVKHEAKLYTVKKEKK
jgi:hypothetical protein